MSIYGFQSPSYPAGAKLAVEDTRWRKIDSHQIPDVKGYIDIRMNFLVENIFIERSSPGATVPPRITFDIQNDTAYSYYEGRFALLLLSGGTVEGVMPLSIKDFRAGQNFPVDVRPVFDISGVDDIEVIPVMDVFDSSEFLPVPK